MNKRSEVLFMKFSKLSLTLVCCEDYKRDCLVKSLFDIFSEDCETAVNGYISVCSRLFSSDKTLSDYIYVMLVSRENRILKNYLNNRSETLLAAVKSDISVFSAIAETSAEEIVEYLKGRFSLDGPDFVLYEKGDTVISAESVISFAERFGSSLFAYNKAFVFENGKLSPAVRFDDISLKDLKNYESQRKRIIDNTLCFINGVKSQNVLLYGDRGTGKSSTVKAVVNEYSELRIVQIPKGSISDIYKIYDIVRDIPLKFILFIDDITFSEEDSGYSFLKQVLEGSVMPMPNNCVIYATTNRRHIIKETESERSGDELHAADARDENMSLADRFGLYVTFLSPDKKEYLDIVKKIAEDEDVKLSEEKLNILAERFALKKCGRSPRTARQFVDTLKARLELGLELENL